MLNADLADTLGNLLLRVTAHKLHPKGCVIKLHPHLFPFENTKIWSNEDYQLLEFLRNLPNVVGKYYEMYEFGRGINEIMESLYMVMCICVVVLCVHNYMSKFTKGNSFSRKIIWNL